LGGRGERDIIQLRRSTDILRTGLNSSRTHIETTKKEKEEDCIRERMACASSRRIQEAAAGVFVMMTDVV
jgi:hypothetical protein